MPHPPYFVATYSGFLVVESDDNDRPRTFAVANVRLATPFDSFEHADATAKWAVRRMYPDDLQYFALLQVSYE